MSDAGSDAGLADPDHLLRTRAATRQVEGHVVGCAFSRDNRVTAFAPGAGEVHRAPRAAAVAASGARGGGAGGAAAGSTPRTASSSRRRSTLPGSGSWRMTGRCCRWPPTSSATAS